MLKDSGTINHCAVLLDRPKTPDNVGTVFRSALALGAQTIILCGPRWPLECHPLNRLKTDPSHAFRHLDVRVVATISDGLALAPEHEIVVVERGLPSRIFLDDLVHPADCLYVFGPEDGSVDLASIPATRRRWAVEIRGATPLSDQKQGCLNLGIAASIVLYDRAAKAQQRQGGRTLARLETA